MLLVILGAGIGLLILGWTRTTRPVEDGVSTVVVPAQYAIQQFVSGMVGVLRAPSDLQNLRAENQRLQKQADELSYQLALLREIEIENTNLRELLQLKEQTPEMLGPESDLLAAEVIGRDPSNLLRYLIIDRGSRDRVAPGMSVITSRGLVGQVREVYSNWAKVVLLTDPSSGVNALVQRSRATGIVEGQTGNSLILRYLPQTEGIAKEGDLVLTSGLGGHFPRRLLIGEITEVQRRDVDMFQEALLRPAVDYDRLEMVIVVRHFTPIGIDAQANDQPGPASSGQ